MRKYELLVLARLLIAQARAGESLKLLESLIPAAEWRGRPAMLVEIHALQAMAYQVQGDLDRAVDALECALSLAEPRGYVGIFTVEGEPMCVLLQEAEKRGIARSIGTEYMRKLVATFDTVEQGSRGAGRQAISTAPAPLRTSALAEPLSAREMEVLRLLNTHLSSTEIAEQLCISANTVRFHIKNVYGKLGVHSRSDAVQRAQELELL
jgi:LuxR family maltose regulon positive regulatory protein